MTMEEFCLKWNDHRSVLLNSVDRLLREDSFVDCTLAAEGQLVRAHKVVLSACSPYFEELLKRHKEERNPIFILKDIKFEEVTAIMSYMYRGEVVIPYDKLGELLRAAESLQVKGLGEKGSGNSSELNGLSQSQRARTPTRVTQQTTPGRPVGAGDARKNSQKSAEVVDLTDEPQNKPRVPVSAVSPRAAPYTPRKYNRKLEYQTSASRVVPRNPNSPSTSNVLPTIQSVTSRSQVSIQQVVQEVVTYSPPAQYVTTQTSSSPIVSRQGPVVQHVTSLASGPQKGASPSRPIVQQMTSPSQGATILQRPQTKSVVPAILRRMPPAATQTLANQLQSNPEEMDISQKQSHRVASPKVPPLRLHMNQGNFSAVQSMQMHSPPLQPTQLQSPPVQPMQRQVSPMQPMQRQASPMQPMQRQVSPMQQMQIQAYTVQTMQVEASPGQSMQGQCLPMQQMSVKSPVQTTLRKSPPVQSVQEMKYGNQSQSQPALLTQGTLFQQNLETESQQLPIVKESKNVVSPSQDNCAMETEERSINVELDATNDSFPPADEDSNETIDPEDKTNVDNSHAPASNEPKKGKRGRPAAVDRPFKCPECTKTFSQKCNMEKHRRIHSGECFQCDICDKNFVGRSTLIRHLRKHSKTSHKCHLCGLMFSSPKLLEDHLSQHAGTSSSDQ